MDHHRGLNFPPASESEPASSSTPVPETEAEDAISSRENNEQVRKRYQDLVVGVEPGRIHPGDEDSVNIQAISMAPRIFQKKRSSWSEDEHRLFLEGMSKLGKGDWRGIAREYVRTRSRVQVASHAQNYFFRQSQKNKQTRKRTCIHDITSWKTKETEASSDAPVAQLANQDSHMQDEEAQQLSDVDIQDPKQ